MDHFYATNVQLVTQICNDSCMICGHSIKEPNVEKSVFQKIYHRHPLRD